MINHDTTTPSLDGNINAADRLSKKEGSQLYHVLLRNAIAVTIGRWAMKLCNFIYTIYVIRLLTEVGFGKYSTVQAFVGLFGVFFELGLAQYVERTIAQDREKTQQLFWNLVLLRLILAVLGITVITSIAFVAQKEGEILLGILIFTSTFIFSALLTPLTTVLTANERFDIMTALQVVAQILTIIASLIFLWFGMGFIGLFLTSYIVMPLHIIGSIWAIKRYHLGPLPFNITPRSWPNFVRASLPFGLTSLALTFNYNVDTVILGYFHPTNVVGWYNVSYRLVFIIVSITDGLLTSMTPSLAREHASDPGEVKVWTQNTLRWFALFALPAAMGVSILAYPIISLLYGQSFIPAVSILAIMAWDIPLVLFNAFCGNVTAAVGLERPAARIYLTSAVLNFTLNILFIPTYGMLAATIITLLTDGLTLIMFFILLSTHMDIGKINPAMLRIAMITLLMGALVWIVRDLPLPLVTILGITLYGVLAILIGLIDLTLFRRFVGWVSTRRV